jgi:hypothetical protein
VLRDLVTFALCNFERGDWGGLVEDMSEARLFDTDPVGDEEINAAFVLCLRESKFLGNSLRFLGESMVLLPKEEETDPRGWEGTTIVARFVAASRAVRYVVS